METSKCNISFVIDYTSSTPVTSATAYYKILGSGNPPTIHHITPLPSSGSNVTLPDIQTPGTYDLNVILKTTNGESAIKQVFFKIGNCNEVSCDAPIINSVTVLSNGQIRMDYLITATNLSTPEYQIATDNNFTNIIQSRVGFLYTPIEDVYMANIPNNTTLYVRVRKHCSQQGISNWSNVVQFTSKNWITQQAPYNSFNPSCCISGKFTNPTDVNEVGSTICSTGNQWTKSVNLTTSTPQIGSRIYLSDGTTPAIPGNLFGFDIGGASGFNQYGIRWIRFAGYDNNEIFDVDPITGIITGTSSFNCSIT